MASRYRIRHDREDPGPPLTYRHARETLRRKLQRHLPARYSLSSDGVNFGPRRSLGDTMNRVSVLMVTGKVGSFCYVHVYKGANEKVITQYSMRKVSVAVAPTPGEIVAEAALSQLGVEYVWAWSEPIGDGDGVAGFDCSGLTKYAYSQVRVELPHSAYWTFRAPQVVTFWSRPLLKVGDLIFYDASSRANPDHIGIYVGDGDVCDASTSADAVVRRPMDANPIYGFGRVPSVNGPL